MHDNNPFAITHIPRSTNNYSKLYIRSLFETRETFNPLKQSYLTLKVHLIPYWDKLKIPQHLAVFPGLFLFSDRVIVCHLQPTEKIILKIPL